MKRISTASDTVTSQRMSVPFSKVQKGKEGREGGREELGGRREEEETRGRGERGGGERKGRESRGGKRGGEEEGKVRGLYAWYVSVGRFQATAKFGKH